MSLFEKIQHRSEDLEKFQHRSEDLEKLPLDLRRMIALYFSFSFVEKYYNLLNISIDDEIIWRLIFEKDFGFNSLLSEVKNFKEEYKIVFNKTCKKRIQYAKDYSLKKLEIDNSLCRVMKRRHLFLNIKYLMENGADVNVRNRKYISPIHWTSGARFDGRYDINMEILAYLILCGADINAQDSSGDSPLLWAVKYDNNNLDRIKYLVEHGANVNLRNNSNISPLHFAAMHDRIEITEYLIEKGADINVKDIRGDTSLIYALNEHNIRIIKYLVEHGADLNLRNKSNETPLRCAVEHGASVWVVKYLKEKGADCSVLSSSQKRCYNL